jgi:hypothetical protein
MTWKLKPLPRSTRSRFSVDEMAKGLAAVYEGAAPAEVVKELYEDRKLKLPKTSAWAVVHGWWRRISKDLAAGNRMTRDICKGYRIDIDEGEEEAGGGSGIYERGVNEEQLAAKVAAAGKTKRRGRPRKVD